MSDKDSSPGWVERLANRLGELLALQEERVRAQIAAGLTETRNALRLRGARAERLTGSRILATGNARLTGWSLRNDDETERATVTITDGMGETLAAFSILAGDSSTVGLPGAGVSVAEGCTATVTGTVEGAVYLGAVD